MEWICGRKSPSGFSASSTAEEVTAGIDGTGLTAIVTGASSGIGLETARVLALRGVHVVMAVRNVTAGKEVKEAILQGIPSAKIDVMQLDLSSISSVREFASEYISLGLPLNLLINNAGVMTLKSMVSKDNIELQFATNHLGHFLMTELLLKAMKNTAQEGNKEGRIINVSSIGHKPMLMGCREPRFNDADFKRFPRSLCYGRSKLANILHTNELARHLKARNMPVTIDPNDIDEEEGAAITANSLHPGVIHTNLARHESLVNGFFKMFGKHLLKSVQQGAATTCYVALHSQVKGLTGKYFVDCNIAEPSQLAKDAKLAKELWDFSLRLTKSK